MLAWLGRRPGLDLLAIVAQQTQLAHLAEQAHLGQVDRGGWLAWLGGLRGLVLLGLLCIGMQTAWSQDPDVATLRLAAHSHLVELGDAMSYLKDPSSSLTLDEVMARRAEGRFIHHHATSLAAGYLPGGAVWVHLRLARDPQTPGDWWLEAAEDLIDDITLYEIAPDGQISVRQGGRALPFAQRELAWHKHAFRLTLEDTAPRDLYLRYASTATLRITPRLFQPGAYDQHRAMEDLIAGAYFGIMTFTLLISGLRAFRYRSLLDGCYALYLFGWTAAISSILAGCNSSA